MAERKKEREMMDYNIYKQPATTIKQTFHYIDIRNLLRFEPYSPYVHLHLLRLIDEFNETEDYEYSLECKRWLDTNDIFAD